MGQLKPIVKQVLKLAVQFAYDWAMNKIENDWFADKKDMPAKKPV